MTDRNNNFTPDGSEKAPGAETRAQRRERLEAEEKAEKLRAAEEKKQARIEEKKQADEEKKQAAEARRKAKEKPPLTAEEKAQKAARAKHIKIAAIVFASVFVLLISAAAIGGYIVTGSDTNYPNVRINGIDVGGLTKEQTLAALDEQGWDDIVDKTLVVTLPAKVSFKVDYVTAGMKLSREQAADAAYSYGRTQGLFGNLFRYFLCCALPVDVDALEKTVNADYLNNRIDGALEQLKLLTADKGYKLDKLTVTDASGKTVATTKTSDTVYTFTMPASQVTVGVTYVKADETTEQPSTKTFSDVSSSDWFADAVKYVSDKGMMNGTGNGKFSPADSTTRGMLMTVIARYAGQDTTGSNPWYQKGMEWAKANGVSDGTAPNANITREQLVTMLYRYAKASGKNVSVGEDTNILSYTDATTVSEYAVPAMQWACGAGIVNGSNGKLNPQNNATRAEVAAILMRFCENVK